MTLSATAQTSYSRLELKADRFFDQREWAQAAATYYQMLKLRPDVASTYGKAIVVNAVRGDTIAEMDLLVKALNAKIPFDSLLSCVKSTGFQLGKSNLYGDFLLRAKETCPWMRRPIDSYLLRYYIYRNDGERMIEYSKIMLQGDPANTGFLMSLAQGAMLCGDYPQAIRAYEEVLATAPDNYDALISLGNYYYLEGRKEEARDYLSRANSIHPTPYVATLLSTLIPPDRK